MKKALIAAVVLVVIIVVAVTLLVSNLDSIVKKGVETAGPKILLADVKLAKVKIELSSGSGELSGFTVGNPKGFTTDYAFDMDRIKISLDPQSVTSDTIHIREVTIDGPKIIYEGALGKSNLNQLQANAAAFAGGGQGSTKKGGESAGDKPGKKVVIDRLQISGGEAHLSMTLLQEKKVSVQLPTITLNDIGKNKPTDFAGVLKAVLMAVNKALVPVIQKELTGLDLSSEGLQQGLQEGADKALQEGQKGATDALKGLFGK